MIQKLTTLNVLKWILNEQYHYYNDWEYTFRLRDLLPIKYFFIPCPFIMESPSYRDKRGECSLLI